MRRAKANLSDAASKVDAVVLRAIKHGHVRAGEIETYARNALGHDFARSPMRAVDVTLQRLRKRGQVRFAAGKGWEVT